MCFDGHVTLVVSSKVLFPEVTQHLLASNADAAKHSKGNGTVDFPECTHHMVRNERGKDAASSRTLKMALTGSARDFLS